MIVCGTADYNGPRERLDLWRHLVAQAFVPMDALPREPVHTPGPFHGKIQFDSMAELQVSEVVASSHSVSRTSRLISNVDREFYQVNVLLSGRCAVLKEDRADLLMPGDLVVLDSSEAFQLVFDGDHRVLCFTFPRRLLPIGRDQVTQLSASRLAGSAGVGALMTPFLRTLAQQVFTQQVNSPARLAGSVVDLTETLLLERFGDLSSAPSESAQRQLLRLRIRGDIQSRLGSPDLGPDEIAAKHHISTRHLHKLFESEGMSVSQWIRELRLERCRRDLIDPTLDQIPVAAIGARWGLRHPAHFSRLFKARYALTPRQYRELRGGATAAIGVS